MLAVLIILDIVCGPTPKSAARASMVSPLLRLSRISGKCLRTSAVRALWGDRGPGLLGTYRPFWTSKRFMTILSQAKVPAIAERDSPALRRATMSGMCASKAPMRRGIGFTILGGLRGPLPTHRPLRTLSSMLSCGVPRNRCTGLVHSGLSQWWQTNRPIGIGPKWIAQETRCAIRYVPAAGLNFPYPSRCFDPNHDQHPSALTTRSQNFSSIVFTESPLFS